MCNKGHTGSRRCWIHGSILLAVTTPRVQLASPGSEFQGWVQTMCPRLAEVVWGKVAEKTLWQVPRARVCIYISVKLTEALSGRDWK